MRIGIDQEDIAGVEGLENIKVSEDSDLYVSIGLGNRKIGLIPSWSLPNKETCSADALRYCGKKCYANRIRELYPGTWDAWGHNYRMYTEHPVLTELLIRKYLALAMPRIMRLHVSGDFFSRDYLDMWKRIVKDHAATLFYGYTKMPWIDHATLPHNLRLLRSMWPGMPVPRQKHVTRNCWVQDGTETRIPNEHTACIGDCPRCGFKCAFGSGDVVINLHR